MAHNSIVIDSNIVIKLVRQEEKSELARDLFRYIAKNRISIISPPLLLTETLNVCDTKKIAIEPVLELFDALFNRGLSFSNIDSAIMHRASEIVKVGNEKSGYPKFPDSFYHAVAIETGAVLITSDHRHYAKVHKKLGHIFMLEDWKTVFVE